MYERSSNPGERHPDPSVEIGHDNAGRRYEITHIRTCEIGVLQTRDGARLGIMLNGKNFAFPGDPDKIRALAQRLIMYAEAPLKEPR